MSRVLGLGAILLATLLGGCQDGPRGGPSPTAVTSSSWAVPSILQGTWRQEGVGFVALGADSVILNLPGLPRRPARITGLTRVGELAAVLTLDNGWILSLAGGRAITSRRLGALDLAGDCPVLDVAAEGPGPGGSWRLWNQESTTWLPLAGASTGGIVAASTVPDVVPSPAKAATEDRLVTAVAALGDESLLRASRALVSLALSGAPRPRLEDQIGETLRVQRLAALDLLATQDADELVILRADQVIGRLEAWQRLTRTWLDSRG